MRSPIAMEPIVTIIKAAASMAPAMWWDSKHTVHCAHRAAYTGAYRATYDSPDRSRCTTALASAFLCAADNALGMSKMRNRQQRQCKCGCGQIKF